MERVRNAGDFRPIAGGSVRTPYHRGTSRENENPAPARVHPSGTRWVAKYNDRGPGVVAVLRKHRLLAGNAPLGRPKHALNDRSNCAPQIPASNSSRDARERERDRGPIAYRQARVAGAEMKRRDDFIVAAISQGWSEPSTPATRNAFSLRRTRFRASSSVAASPLKRGHGRRKAFRP